MSRIGKLAVPVPDGVTATIDGSTVTAKGPKGQLAVTLVEEVTAKLEDASIRISPRDQSTRARCMWGMQRSIVRNLIEGVSIGFSKELELRGTGYRAQMQGKELKLLLGFSHDVIYSAPQGIDIACPSQTQVIVSGIDKQKVGQVAAEIRSYRPPEPYKGKGIRYKDEYIFMKEGKKK